MFEGAPLLILHTVGARTGTRRETPLMYQQRGDAWAVFASKAGADDNPDWFYNITANPDTKIEVGTETIDVSARVASGDEHTEIWEQQKQDWPAVRRVRGQDRPLGHSGDRARTSLSPEGGTARRMAGVPRTSIARHREPCWLSLCLACGDDDGRNWRRNARRPRPGHRNWATTSLPGRISAPAAAAQWRLDPGTEEQTAAFDSDSEDGFLRLSGDVVEGCAVAPGRPRGILRRGSRVPVRVTGSRPQRLERAAVAADRLRRMTTASDLTAFSPGSVPVEGSRVDGDHAYGDGSRRGRHRLHHSPPGPQRRPDGCRRR